MRREDMPSRFCPTAGLDDTGLNEYLEERLGRLRDTRKLIGFEELVHIIGGARPDDVEAVLAVPDARLFSIWYP